MNRLWLDFADKMKELAGIPSQLSAIQRSIENQTEAIDQCKKAANEGKQNQLPIPLPVKAELQIPEAEQAEKRKQHNDSHTVQIWLTVGTWLTFIAAAVYAGIAAKQWSTAKDQLEATSRPWIEMVGNFPNPKSMEGFDVILTNHGNSPAIVAGWPHFTLGDLLKKEPRMWTVNGGKDVCDYVERMPGVEGPEGWTRFPIPIFPKAPKEIIAQVGQGFPHSSPVLYDYLSGCVIYKGPTGKVYKTRIIYHITYALDHSISEIDPNPWVDAQ
ncbi:MAG: hypothetical protein HY010_21200 [Acidobacteria bacterium]|nr:hypothetical protein [Acidobacteriota bacterium]